MGKDRIEQISREIFSLLGTERQIPPITARYDGFDLDEAYRVVARVRDLRMTRGENPVGRKIGFTNRSVWSGLGLSAPIWNYVFDRTVMDGSESAIAFGLGSMPEPRIEPEIVLHLKAGPTVGMSESELITCIDWFAAGYEIVYSVFPGWRFSAADAAAAFGVHGSLIIGAKQHVLSDAAQQKDILSTFSVVMTNDRGDSRSGHAGNVLGGPLKALNYLVEDIARKPWCEPLQAGETVTTGTLTEAMPAEPGTIWTTRFSGIDLPSLQLRLC